MCVCQRLHVQVYVRKWLIVVNSIDSTALNHSFFQNRVQNIWEWIYIPPHDFDLTPVICFIHQFISTHDTSMIIK